MATANGPKEQAYDLAERITALEVANVPTNTELHARLYELEQWRDRTRRGI